MWIPVLLSVLCFCFVAPAATSLISDAHILIRVKDSQLQDPLHRLSDWTLSSANPPCNWTGITCDGTGAVSVINLASLNITGEFPSNFCRIHTLKNLTVAYNNLTGKIHPSISLCSRLLYLNLALNGFEGPVPDLWSGFSHLRILDLSQNYLSGDVPSSIGKLTSLKELHLYGNFFNGTFPYFILNLTELTNFTMAANFALTPSPLPFDIGNLTKLEYLWLTSSNLVGEIPESIGRLVELKNLDLASNRLTGEIPKSIGGLKNVVQIELFDNNLHGELPESLSELRNLRRLDVSQNNLSGTLSEKIARLPFESFNLNDNLFEGKIPQVLALSPNLWQLKLFNNSFSGSLPVELGRYSKLKEFDASTNRLTGELPKNLCYGKKLQSLILFDNRFSGNIPESYGDCTSLTYVRIGNCGLSGEVPWNFWSVQGFTRIELSNNNFGGTIPPSVAGPAGNLTRLVISGNNFSGDLPVEICKLYNLQELDVSRNELSGKIPDCITNLRGLQKLDLQENVFSGEIPSNVDSWTGLNELNLSNNHFSGDIPSKLGQLPALNYLDLSVNDLSGGIPFELTKLRLTRFNLSANNLRGPVPVEFRYSPSSFLYNPLLCSLVPDMNPLPHCSKTEFVTWHGITIVVAIVALLGLGFLIWFLRIEYIPFGSNPKRPWNLVTYHRSGFSEEEVLSSLSENNLIGSGSSGQVFRVKLKTGQTVAVKRLWGGNKKTNTDTDAVFQSEVETLGQIRHSKIVKLLFSCYGEDIRVLVYEYLENGSLGDILHGVKGGSLLDWPKRFKIALGAAQGLAYLHHDCVPAIVHRDVKSNNILLDEDFCPRVADFGLAKSLQKDIDDGNAAMSRIAGSYGYIAPEYAYTLKVTEKSDVYSFGVLLMELVSGKSPNDASFGENKDIVKWVTESALLSPYPASGNWMAGCGNSRDLGQVIDPRMKKPADCDFEQIEDVLNVALLCTSSFPMNRPSMRRVVELLQGQKAARGK